MFSYRPPSLRLPSLRIALAITVLGLTTTACLAQAGGSVASTSEIVMVPMKGAGSFGSSLNLSAELFKPAGPGPFPVLIYAHGRSGTQQERSALVEVVPRQFLSFWLAKGFAVVAPARPGYGKTGGTDREIGGHRWVAGGACTGAPDAQRVAATAAAAISATLAWTREQPWAQGSKIVLAGNSVGGLSSTALAAANPAGVVAYINFAGGIGGNPGLSPGKSCSPATLREAFASYGKTSRIPGLWLYAPNDLFWGAEAPKEWHAAFVAGGGQAEMVATPALPNVDGHELIFVGRDLWDAAVSGFLKRVGLE